MKRGVERNPANVREEYFEWLCSLIEFNHPKPYNKLYRLLYDRDFIFTLQRDQNRAVDGVDLRYRFAYERGFTASEIEMSFGAKPCSVFEMMIALASRVEEHIMLDEGAGDRTKFWFQDMLTSLGLKDMADYVFDAREANYILDRFLYRQYASDGEGSLFTIKHCEEDLREVEIWYQAQQYFTELLFERS